jgi:hypothetical protein
MEYFKLAPWGEERADQRAAIMPTLFANAFRGKGRRAYKLEEFMPTYRAEPKRKKTDAEMEAICRAFSAVHNVTQRKKT